MDRKPRYGEYKYFDDVENKVLRYNTNSALVFIPHVDTTMPFTILTMTMGLLGFVAVTFFTATFFDEIEVKEPLLKKLVRKLLGKFKRGGSTEEKLKKE